MKIKAKYSHLNGEEYLLVHRKQLWEEVQTVIEDVDAYSCRTKISREKTMPGRLLYSPTDMNKAFKEQLNPKGWSERRSTFWVTSDENLLSPNPPNGVGRALEQDITGMERRPTRRIWDGRGQ